jgi:hypothetical protein
MHIKNTVGGKFTASAFAMALLLAIGCVTPAPPPPPPQAEKAPEWVNKGSGAFKDGGQNVFYGVGVSQGIRNRALLITTADDRARAEIAKVMESYVAVLSKDYMASTAAGETDKSSEEQHVSQTLKSFSKFTLHGVYIVDHYRDPSDGSQFALAKLDMAAVKKNLEDAKDLDAKVRDYVRSNAEKAFDELAAEEARH